MSEVKFFNAICDGDIETLKILLQRTPDLVQSRKSDSAKPCLHVCFEKRHDDGKYCECLELLVDHGADINEIYDRRHEMYHSWTPIMVALHVKCLRCLKFLIAKGADLSIETKNKNTALILAVKQRKLIIVETLIQHSSPALINHRDGKGKTALMWAAERHGQDAFSLIQKLIETGADVNIPDKDGDTVLIFAVKKNNIILAEYLIQRSTPVLVNCRDNFGKTALMLTVERHGDDAPSLIQKLIEAGADVKIPDRDGDTALIQAVKKNNITLAEYLIQRSTSELVNHRDNFGRTALMWAAECHGRHAPSLIQKLIEAGADENITDIDGITALIRAVMLAVTKKEFQNADVLIQHSTPALINHRDNCGRTALMFAAFSNLYRYNDYHSDIAVSLWPFWRVYLCEHLIEAGADVNLRDNNGETALSFALEKENFEVVLLLLEKGAFLNTISISGKTPLYQAFKERNWSLLNQSFSKGADPTLSFRHVSFIYQSITNKKASVLRQLVKNGFPPQDCTHLKISFLRYTYNLQHSVSPLSLALWENQPAMARYLITNKFLTLSDINQSLAQNKKLRQRLTQFETNECLQILDFHLQTVQTLSTICLVTITSALTQDFRDENNVRCPPSANWRFTPTFKERVESLGLPSKLQRALLHQTPSSRICCTQWRNISLKEERQFPDCNECVHCTGKIQYSDNFY